MTEGTMTETSPTATGRLTTAAEFLADLDELAPFIESYGEWNEVHQEIHPDVLKVMDEHGYYEISKPRELGGLQLPLLDTMRIMSRFYEIDASTAWIVGSRSSLYRQLAFLDFDTAMELSRDRPPIVAGQGNPSRATAEAVEGGFCVSGDWSYGSGFRYADLMIGAAKVTRDGEIQFREDGSLDLIMFLFPKSAAEDKGNWDVLGLRATGSVDYGVRELFVPTEMTIVGGNAGGYKWGEVNQVMGLAGYVLAGHTNHETGLGQRLLDEIAAYAVVAKSRGRLADSEIFRHDFAQHASKFKAGVAWSGVIWADIAASVDRGEALTRDQLTDARAALLLTSKVLKEMAEWFFEEAGGNILRAGPLQRLYRNIKANGTHHHLSRKFYQDVARDYLGLAEDLKWTPNGLVKA
jgi:alkylation response protein AidB-like acyl-CoA dehydrogenase